MGLFDIFRKAPQPSGYGAGNVKPSLFSDLVQYVKDHIWASGPQSMPSFTAEAQAFAEKDSWKRAMEEGMRQLNSYRPYDAPVVETVSSDSVFDIYNIDSHNFWDHHRSVEADYMELASHLPEIQERLANGESLDSIRSIPHLSNTIDAYYTDDKMIRVAKDKDGYQFLNEGRHRMMAAKEMGYDVPVKIVGENVAEEEETDEEEVEVTEDDTKALEEAEKEAEEEKARLEKEMEEEEAKLEKEMEEEEVRVEKELEEEEAEAEKEAEAREEEAEKEAKAQEEEAEKEVKKETEAQEGDGKGHDGEDLDGGMEY